MSPHSDLATEELVHAFAALNEAATSLSLAVALARNFAARTDTAVLAEAVEAEIRAVDAVMRRHYR